MGFLWWVIEVVSWNIALKQSIYFSVAQDYFLVLLTFKSIPSLQPSDEVVYNTAYSFKNHL